jgi:hypothetical protein
MREPLAELRHQLSESDGDPAKLSVEPADCIGSLVRAVGVEVDPTLREDEPSRVDRLLLFVVDAEAEYGVGNDRIRRVGRRPGVV